MNVMHKARKHHWYTGEDSYSLCGLDGRFSEEEQEAFAIALDSAPAIRAVEDRKELENMIREYIPRTNRKRNNHKKHRAYQTPKVQEEKPT